MLKVTFFDFCMCLTKGLKSSVTRFFLQFYNTWGRPFGYEEECSDYPQFCTYSSMQDALTNSYSTFACMNRPSR